MRHRVTQAIHRIAGRPPADQRPHADDGFRSIGHVPDTTLLAGAVALAMAAYWQLAVGSSAPPPPHTSDLARIALPHPTTYTSPTRRSTAKCANNA